MTNLPFIYTEIHQGIASIRIDRPPSNAINPLVAAGLETAIVAALANSEVTGLVLTSAAKCFSAGADLGFFCRQVKGKDWDRAEQFSQCLHRVGTLLAEGGKPTVAAIRGPTLGAGLELALACNRIVASRTATIALPETGLGICPGGGGTQRLPRRIGYGPAKWLIYTGHLLSGHDAARWGVVDTCVADQDLELAAADELRSLNRVVPSPGRGASLPSDEYLAWAFANHSVHALLGLADAHKVPDDWDTRTRRAVQKLTSRSVHALLLAEELIDHGQRLPLTKALELEIGAQRRMFEHPDVEQRLSAALLTQEAKAVSHDR